MAQIFPKLGNLFANVPLLIILLYQLKLFSYMLGCGEIFQQRLALIPFMNLNSVLPYYCLVIIILIFLCMDYDRHPH